ncbi:MAG: fumarylacetoacetate hydrolase family protein [Planctomycetota bacterium]|nr:fumarylacetoacetate hydrolase family protein [Planctomycetota bacterium]
MRLCRFLNAGTPRAAFYSEDRLIPLAAASAIYAQRVGGRLDVPESDDLLLSLPGGTAHDAVSRLSTWVSGAGAADVATIAIPAAVAHLLVPIPRPNKLFLLAGNYADHIKEGGGIAAERAETFPYVFMKPPTTTLTNPGQPIRIPRVSPGAIDWELELAVVIGKRVKGVSEVEALSAVAGYTVINDISNRKFKPNPTRKERAKDSFFDWLHGKWHDSFCPCGPCVVSADAIADPQSLPMRLSLNDQVRQNASTALMIFPVAAIIEFISSFVTLEPGDIISTGTPAGVGSTTGTFLKPGDVLTAHIDSIGTLVTPVQSEE